MLNIIKWELFRLFKQKKTYIGLITLLLINVLMGLALSTLANQDNEGPIIVEGPEDIQFGTIHPLTFALISFNSHLDLLIPIFIILAVTDLFTGDYVKGTMKGLLIRPFSRTKIFFAKFISCYIYSLFFLCFAAVFGIGTGYVFFDTSAPLALQLGMTRVITFSTFPDFLLNLIQLIAISSVPLMAFGAIVTFAAVTINSVSAVNFLGIGYLIVSSVVEQFWDKMEYVLNTTHLVMGSRFLEDSFLLRDMATPIIVVLSFLVLFTLGAWQAFKKKEILL